MRSPARLRPLCEGWGIPSVVQDLCAEGFDPLMPGSEFAKNAVLPPEIERHCQEVENADALVVVHPNWWSAPPAILRGWVDRVLRPGRAYEFVPDGQGGAKPVGFLKARVGGGVQYGEHAAGKGGGVVWGSAGSALAQSGLWSLRRARGSIRRNFSPVITSTPEQRKNWLEEVRRIMGQIAV